MASYQCNTHLSTSKWCDKGHRVWNYKKNFPLPLKAKKDKKEYTRSADTKGMKPKMSSLWWHLLGIPKGCESGAITPFQQA
jgi:hypothetical protein